NGMSLTASFANRTLTLSGTDTLAHYQQALRLISYNNTANGVGVTQQKVTFTATDGTVTSTPVTATVNVSMGSGQVLGNRLFYNTSRFDGHDNLTAGDGAINSFDDAAVAPDKTGYLGNGTATFANVSSSSKGITGIIIDVASNIGNHSL